MAINLTAIQKTIGYQFKNADLLQQAFVRRSYSEENGGQNNEVLEFIGDKALDLVVIRLMMERFGKITEDKEWSEFKLRNPKHFQTRYTEGVFTDIKQQLVQKKALARSMTMLGFHNELIMGEGDIKNNVQNQDSVKEDLFEAIVGAVTLDCNWDMDKITSAVDQMIDFESFFQNEIDLYENYVGKVQQWFQSKGYGIPVYEKYGDWYSDGKIGCSLNVPGVGVYFRERDTSFPKARMAVAKKVFDYLLEHGMIENPYIEAVGQPDEEDILRQMNELQQKKLIPAPIYEFDKDYDEDGNPEWLSQIYVDGVDNTFLGCDSSKKAAQRECAKQMLDYIIFDYNQTGVQVTENGYPDIYRLKVYYDRHVKTQWRTIDILSDSSFNELCYTIMASFNTRAYHEFGIQYEEDGEMKFISDDDMCDSLSTLDFDKLKVIYDFGFEKVFYVKLVDILEYKPGTANQYPKIVGGKGKGVIDDITSDEYSEIVKKIKAGKMTYTYDGMSDEEKPWHPDDYSVEKDDSNIRSYVRKIRYANENGYDE